MKTILLFLSLAVGFTSIHSQIQKSYIISDVFFANCSFGDTSNNGSDGSVFLAPLSDSISGIWNIAQPLKSTINSVNNGSYMIITDSINPYPINDSSSFIIHQIDQGGFGDNPYDYPHTSYITGYYWSNTDSLNDYGTIEIKLPCIHEWIDITADSIYNYYSGTMMLTSDVVYWESDKPVLTGNSNGWRQFGVNIVDSEIPNFCTVYYGDTVKFRFRFHSDSISDSLDGLAFDEIEFCNYFEGIDEYNRNVSIQLSPNPATSQFQVKTDYAWETYEIYSSIGEIVQTGKKGLENTINVSSLREGIYLVSILNEEQQVGTGRFVKD